MTAQWGGSPRRVTAGRWRRLVLLVAACALATPAAAARRAVELVGTVTRVVDGDTLSFAPADGGRVLTVRLEGIDAPESCQPWGAQAREALEALVRDRTLTLRVVGRDDHGRTLGRLRHDGVDLGERLVRDGHAWSHRYRHDRGPFVAQERMARALRRGLHADGTALMPREFRRRHGPCAHGVDAPRPAAGASQVPAPGDLRCDGRTQCGQMRSCEEATFFLRHCPDTQMDGDGDGVPCERQWCGR